MWAATAAKLRKIRREERRGRSCLSEMAVLHNIFREGIERKRGKMAGKKRRGCVTWTWVGEAWHQLVFLFQFFDFKLAEWVQRSDQKFGFFKRWSQTEVQLQRDWILWVDLVIQGAVRDRHKQTYSRPLRRGVLTLVHSQSRERECEVHCYLWNTRCRWEENLFSVASPVAGLLFSFLVLLLFPYAIRFSCVGRMNR